MRTSLLASILLAAPWVASALPTTSTSPDTLTSLESALLNATESTGETYGLVCMLAPLHPDIKDVTATTVVGGVRYMTVTEFMATETVYMGVDATWSTFVPAPTAPTAVVTETVGTGEVETETKTVTSTLVHTVDALTTVCPSRGTYTLTLTPPAHASDVTSITPVTSTTFVRSPQTVTITDGGPWVITETKTITVEEAHKTAIIVIGGSETRTKTIHVPTVTPGGYQVITDTIYETVTLPGGDGEVSTQTVTSTYSVPTVVHTETMTVTEGEGSETSVVTKTITETLPVETEYTTAYTTTVAGGAETVVTETVTETIEYPTSIATLVKEVVTSVYTITSEGTPVVTTETITQTVVPPVETVVTTEYTTTIFGTPVPVTETITSTITPTPPAVTDVVTSVYTTTLGGAETVVTETVTQTLPAEVLTETVVSTVSLPSGGVSTLTDVITVTTPVGGGTVTTTTTTSPAGGETITTPTGGDSTTPSGSTGTSTTCTDTTPTGGNTTPATPTTTALTPPGVIPVIPSVPFANTSVTITIPVSTGASPTSTCTDLTGVVGSITATPSGSTPSTTGTPSGTTTTDLPVSTSCVASFKNLGNTGGSCYGKWTSWNNWISGWKDEMDNVNTCIPGSETPATPSECANLDDVVGQLTDALSGDLDSCFDDLKKELQKRPELTEDHCEALVGELKASFAGDYVTCAHNAVKSPRATCKDKTGNVVTSAKKVKRTSFGVDADLSTYFSNLGAGLTCTDSTAEDVSSCNAGSWWADAAGLSAVFTGNKWNYGGAWSNDWWNWNTDECQIPDSTPDFCSDSTNVMTYYPWLVYQVREEIIGKLTDKMSNGGTWSATLTASCQAKGLGDLNFDAELDNVRDGCQGKAWGADGSLSASTQLCSIASKVNQLTYGVCTALKSDWTSNHSGRSN
ncbi:hypothetical protein SAICODRAFT_21803 [Saitoella complicata NRRL Y-17804]|uniref:uncharacterized protein n=1 Tax=Saitoella complicata (strain BCRC 22490 / CBS 7301 / JCM 7358 / NBRC 10748 / NRRL Y-17804) TaxID=698492 RepID=UPI0008680B54|nr:uncharacterized protein SAICODRAFT_21803 [Saitoella complicata NRRL Y-17804]ODQ50317.1 hypothetical protein SAICODRAFT_21803 [Saitoella complicata NRRL Y-17804]